MSSKKQRSARSVTMTARPSAKSKPARAPQREGHKRADRKKDPTLAPPKMAQSDTALAARAGTKQAQVIALLSRPSGAGLTDLVKTTGWLPHTARAALTGLRKKGYPLEKSKSADGTTIYQIAGAARVTGVAADAAA